MTFQFENFNALLTMGGHGGYVWGCYALALVTLTLLVMTPVWARKRFVKQQQQWRQRTDALKQSRGG